MSGFNNAEPETILVAFVLCDCLGGTKLTDLVPPLPIIFFCVSPPVEGVTAGAFVPLPEWRCTLPGEVLPLCVCFIGDICLPRCE